MRALLTLLAVCLAATGVRAAEPDFSKDPVILVHGYFLGESMTWAWMKSRLVEAGWPEESLVSFQFESVFGCNPQHGNELKAKVDEVLAATGRDRVDILCHSMGCVDARYYIKYLCGYQTVRDVVSIAGAHKGTSVGCLDPISCGAEQLCVKPFDGAWMQNDFLKKLNWCDITPGEEVRYTSIWSPLDEIIVPQENSIIEGALNVKLSALAEHALILANEETAQWVITGLDGGGTNDNNPTAQPPCVTLCEEPVPPEPAPDVVAWDSAPESVEAAPDVVPAPEPVPDRVETHTPDLVAGPEPLPGGDIPGTGDTITADSPAATPPDAPRHLLARRSGGCTATPTAGPVPWFLLLIIPLLRRRRMHHRDAESAEE